MSGSVETAKQQHQQQQQVTELFWLPFTFIHINLSCRHYPRSCPTQTETMDRSVMNKHRYLFRDPWEQ